MLLIPVSVFASAAVLLTVALVVVSREQRRNDRLFLGRLRNWLDRVCESTARSARGFVHVIAISVMYLVHHFRSALSKAIAPRPRRPKKQPDRLQFEKTDNHLSSMHEHKSDTALTPAQKKKLRNQKLEERL